MFTQKKNSTLRAFFSILAACTMFTFVSTTHFAHSATAGIPETRTTHDNITYYSKASWSIGPTSDGTKYVVTGFSRKSKVGGDSAYWYAILQASSGRCISGIQSAVTISCHLEYHDYANIEGIRTNSNTWVKSIRSYPVQVNSKSGTVGIKSCVDLRFRFDKCSNIQFSPKAIQFRS